ncbi:hypothetical protein D8B26_005973 [Coccidioides posadasii str. Silveira]|uniref:Spindle pole body component n=1 Tax=Coccidioides posadasii (strain RMSCC 757 / Silveira) TaxID=443226 RepID=E9DI51_COCPS|nr:conserved hypothetical protein [Coccidioides posadasii str. Silveira]QVM11320.1 hypothetical protein D8B26_005973 [Coccidioides posadasii str. Silveira]
MELQNINDPFTLESSREPSFFKLQPQKPLEHFAWDDSLPDLAHGIFESQSHVFVKDDSNIYALNVFGDEPSDPIESAPPSSSSSRVGGDHVSGTDALSDTGDIWELKSVSDPAPDDCLLRAWDTFPDHRRSYKSSSPTYLSESGSHGFDVALTFWASQTGLEDSGRVVRTDIFMLSLFKLGMGWNSIFFRFNEQTRKFEKAMRDIRISGISLTSLDAFIDELLHCGSQVRRARRFLASVPTKANLPAALANLSRALYVILYSLESQLFERFKSGPSLLETQMLFRRSQCLIKCLVDIIDTLENTTTEGGVISSIFIKCDHLAHEFLWLTDILHEILTITAGSWLFYIAKLLGLPVGSLGAEMSNGNYFHVPIREISHTTRYQRDFETGLQTISSEMPGIISSEHSEAILENAKSLRFLRCFHSDHPLSQKCKPYDPVSLVSPSLECGFTWGDMDRIQQKAKAYEQNVRSEILKYNRRGESFNQVDGEQIETIHEDAHGIDEPISSIFELSDLDDLAPNRPRILERSESIASHRLYRLISESPCVNAERSLGVELPFGPPLMSALYLSFAPVVSAQTRLINFSCLHLLFKKHKLREHLHLQWRFQLFGDGAFLSRLSTVLFDPDMQSGERRSGVARGGTSTGLRLGSRDTWPPASSELRLVLMGLLTECHAEYERSNSTSQLEANKTKKELPGGLSFSIRELPDEELVECKDPNSVKALDFLRLQYTAPPMLEDVVTSRSLGKYDRIFKHLLRLLRLLSTVRGLVRSQSSNHSHPSLACGHRFCFEAVHFIQAIGEYCFHICVGEIWRKFERTLSRIERCIDDGDIDGTIEHAKSLRRLREYHEDVLDQILFAMLLNKKHSQAYALLEDIFGTIITFSLHWKAVNYRENVPASREQSIRELHLVFRKQIGALVRFLRGLGSVRSAQKRTRHDDLGASRTERAMDIDINTIFDHLLLRLDMTEFY